MVGTFNRFRWALIILFLILSIFTALGTKIPFLSSVDPLILNSVESLIFTILIFIIVLLHGIERYNKKGMVLFFLITFAVSYFFENLSIQTGFPFGFYHYSSTLGVLTVPLIIVFAYFAVGYLSWMLAHVLTGQYTQKLEGKQIFIVPLIASFLMVMWDLTMDPVSSTIDGLWVWQTPGVYFGVPISNFVGWFLVVYIFFQIFAIYISRYDSISSKKIDILSNKPYWLEAGILYGIMALGNILIIISMNNAITQSMGLVTIFTMIFVAILSLITITNNPELK
ncbi:MAG: carotenoid biosynthesis protein [Methanobacterium sp.]|nr:carotenoid biosynthesis protein [Methanobacterium sp.]